MKLHAHFELDHNSSHGCERCGKVFESRGAFKNHFKTDCEGALHCDTCGHMTGDKQSMKAHLIKHFKIEDVFVCSCGQKFISQKLLDGHVKRHGKAEEQLFICEACGKQYDKYASIRKHRMSFHPDLFPCLVYKCPACKFVTKCLETFERHQKTHLTAKHVCEVCGKSFSSSTALRIHSNIHTGNKPYECQVCGKRFSSPNYLRKHHSVHDSPYSKHSIQCRNCLRFVLKSSYESHETVCRVNDGKQGVAPTSLS